MNRRTFTFASLAIAVNQASAQATGRARAPAGMLTAEWTHTVAGGILVLRLKATNRTKEPVSVMVSYGSEPGAAVLAFLAGPTETRLPLVTSDVLNREAMSRIGPQPHFVNLARGAETDLGEFKFVLPPGSEKEAFRVTATVITGKGDVVFNLAIPNGGPAST